MRGAFDLHDPERRRLLMRDVNTAALRTALALPLAYEAYRLLVFAVRADSWDALSLLANKSVSLLPALALGLGCVLALLDRGSRWLWLVPAVGGAWLIFVDLYQWRGVAAPWRPSVDLAMGLYAVLLAVAFLLGHSRQARSASAPGSIGAGR
jgi:hypothetical protein